MAAAVTLAFACMPVCARAATITVNTEKDLASGGGKCSLREAIIAANTDSAVKESDCTPGSGANTIVLPANTNPYKLEIAPTGGDDASSGDLNITAPVTLSGAGAKGTVIRQTKEDRVIDVERPGVRISGVTIESGYVPAGEGGGVLVSEGAALTLASSDVLETKPTTGAGYSSKNTAKRRSKTA